MLKVDTAMLSRKIQESGFSKLSLSIKLGINRNTVTDYMKDPEKMTIRIINKIALILCLTKDDFDRIFFYN